MRRTGGLTERSRPRHSAVRYRQGAQAEMLHALKVLVVFLGMLLMFAAVAGV